MTTFMGQRLGWVRQPWKAPQELSRAEAPLADESPSVLGLTKTHPGVLLKPRHCILNRALAS